MSDKLSEFLSNIVNSPFVYSLYLMAFFISADGLTIDIGRNWQISQLLTLVIFVLITISVFHNKRNKFKVPKNIFVILSLFVASIVVSILFMPASPKYIPIDDLSYWEQYGISSYMYLFWILLDTLMLFAVYKIINSKKILINVVKIAIYSSLVFSLYGIYQFIVVTVFGTNGHSIIFSANYGYLREEYIRLLSFAREPLYYACFLNFVLGLMIPKLNSAEDQIYGIKKTNWILIFCINVIALILTKSLGGIAGLIAIIFANSFLAIKLNNRKIDYTFYLKILGLCLFVLAFLFLNYSSIESKVTRMFNPESNYGRIISLIQAVDLIKENPLLGIGMGNSVFYVSNNQIHNAYVNITTELGILGISTFLTFLFLVFRGLFKTCIYSIDSQYKFLAIGLICSLVGILTQFLSFYAYMINLFWFVLGIAIALIKLASIHSKIYIYR